MPKISYAGAAQATKLSASKLEVIARANEIITEYKSAGFRLTLRQLYYQFVARGLIANQQREYKRLGTIIGEARLAGLIDWDAIEDRSRNLRKDASWESPEDIVGAAALAFRRDLWATQPWYVEVWVEKEALIGVVEQACEQRRVPHFACKGYASLSEIWAAGHYRFRAALRAGKRARVIHLGDHDPSGIDMTRDITERLNLFAGGRRGLVIERIALNMDQIEELGPPPNPAKATDSRFADYLQQFGDESWELDAIEPRRLVTLIAEAVEPLIDEEAWDLAVKQELHERSVLERVAEHYGEICSHFHFDA